MNELRGTVLDIASENHLSVVHLSVYGERVTSVVLETSGSAPHLKVGNELRILFKETEVVIGKPSLQGISLQNRFPCRITALEHGKILSRLILTFHEAQIISIITSSAVNQLDLKVGDEVIALVKTNEVMLSI